MPWPRHTTLLPRPPTSPCLGSLLLAGLLVGTVAAAPGTVRQPPQPAPCQDPIPQLYQRVSPAVVLITAMSINPYSTGDRMERQAGSGFLIDPAGLIVTNSHVVFGSQVVTVTLDDGTILPARVVGADPMFDVAVIRIPSPKGTLPTAQLGDSEHLLVGEEVFAIGNPLGLEQTFTRGIVSAVNRILPGVSWALKEPMIQTDAAINRGSSGGPLVDRCGRVVGINTAIIPDAQSIGFAIPADVVRKILPDLIAKGRVVRPWLGVQGQLVPRALRELLRVPLTDGLLVEVVEPGSPAARLGLVGGDLDISVAGNPVLLGGDIITEINGTTVNKPEQVKQALESLVVGETVHLKLFRESETREVDVVLVERPVLPADLRARQAVAPVASDGLAVPWRGLHSTRSSF
jgi:serine protease Do